ncbi:hypothetical protein ACFQX4_04915 [Roseomonas sp. GCM10028921]
MDRLLLHLFQHGIHHRGQAHAMLSGTSVARCNSTSSSPRRPRCARGSSPNSAGGRRRSGPPAPEARAPASAAKLRAPACATRPRAARPGSAAADGRGHARGEGERVRHRPRGAVGHGDLHAQEAAGGHADADLPLHPHPPEATVQRGAGEISAAGRQAGARGDGELAPRPVRGERRGFRDRPLHFRRQVGLGHGGPAEVVEKDIGHRDAAGGDVLHHLPRARVAGGHVLHGAALEARHLGGQAGEDGFQGRRPGRGRRLDRRAALQPEEAEAREEQPAPRGQGAAGGTARPRAHRHPLRHPPHHAPGPNAPRPRGARAQEDRGSASHWP